VFKTAHCSVRRCHGAVHSAARATTCARRGVLAGKPCTRHRQTPQYEARCSQHSVPAPFFFPRATRGILTWLYGTFVRACLQPRVPARPLRAAHAGLGRRLINRRPVFLPVPKVPLASSLRELSGRCLAGTRRRCIPTQPAMRCATRRMVSTAARYAGSWERTSRLYRGCLRRGVCCSRLVEPRWPEGPGRVRMRDIVQCAWLSCELKRCVVMKPEP
jgi:hypothetical protein